MVNHCAVNSITFKFHSPEKLLQYFLGQTFYQTYLLFLLPFYHY